MKKLWKYVRGYEKESVLGPLFKLFEALLELLVPLVVAAIIDKGIGGGDKGYLVKACLLLVGLGAAGLLFSVTAQYFAAKASVGFVTALRHSLFSHVSGFSYTELDTVGVSTLITRMTTDANQVQSGYNMTLRLLLRSPFVVFGAMIMALSIPLYKKVQQKLDRVVSSTRENIAGVRVIRAFCKEEEEEAEFRRRNNDLTRIQKFVGRISNLLNPVTYILINLATIYLIYTGALRVDTGDLTQGEVVALYNYMAQILVELVKFASLIISITRALASAGRIAAVLDIEPGMEEGAASFHGVSGEEAVRFENVSLRYQNAGENSLDSISFSVKKGETVGIIGGTGSGKSSLVNLIPRFYDATEGSVRIDGKNVREYDSASLRAKIGVVPQKAVLFSGTIRENLLWGKEDADDEALWEALRVAQADRVVADKGGLDAVVEAGGRNLSGGQRQRLTIARALVRRPEILILDDAASALDFATDAALRRALREIRETTVFIVSQRASSLMHADKIVVLDDGEAVGVGRHEELLSDCPLYREIYETQFPSKTEDREGGEVHG